MSWKVIDISRYQGDVDFNKIKSQVDGVIIRAGIGSYSTGALQEDSKFIQNVNGCIQNNIPFGFYYFTQSVTTSDAVAEANFLIERAKKYSPKLPLVYDVEGGGRLDGQTKSQITNNALAFCKRIKDSGYRPLVYSYKSYFDSYLNESSIKSAGYGRWIAHYTSASHPEYATEYEMWQYTSSGSINGISGSVDINHCYVNYGFGGGIVPTFVPRTTAPSSGDLNWINVSYGGRNRAIVINSSTGSVLPNCVGYVNGRWIELGVDPSLICVNNADSFWTHKDNFGRGQTPKLGAILCWSCTGKCGHVAVVEKINSDGTVLASQSNYGGTRFYTKTFNPKSWPVGYNFQGYVYIPINFSDKVGSPVNRDITRHQVEIVATSLRARSRPELSSATQIGIMNTGYYNVIAERDLRNEASNGYLWFEIEPDVWIATKDGDWTIDLPAQASAVYLKIGYASKGDINQIANLLTSLGIAYTESDGYITTTVKVSSGDISTISSYCADKGVPCVEIPATDDAVTPTPPDDNNDSLIEDLREALAEAQEFAESMQETNTELLAEVSSLNTEVDTLTDAVGTLNNTVTTLNNKIVTLEDDVASLTSSNQTLTTKVKNLTNSNKTLTSKIDKIKEIVN